MLDGQEPVFSFVPPASWPEPVEILLRAVLPAPAISPLSGALAEHYK
jgi:hypothetical protein